MPQTISNQTTGLQYTDRCTIQPSNFEAIEFAIYNAACFVEVANMPQGAYQQGDFGGELLVVPGTTTLSRASGVRFRTNNKPGSGAVIASATMGQPGTLTYAGDYSGTFQVGTRFQITGSAANDGTYTVASVSYDAGSNVTTVTTVENLPASSGAGTSYPAAQIIAYAWKDDEPVISGQVAPSGTLGASGFAPFSPAPQPQPLGGYLPHEQWTGGFTSCPNGVPTLITFDTSLGPDSLLDNTIPAAPVWKATGTYAVSISLQSSTSTLLDNNSFIEFAVFLDNPSVITASNFGPVATTAAGLSNTRITGVSLSLTEYVAAGKSMGVYATVTNGSGPIDVKLIGGAIQQMA